MKNISIVGYSPYHFAIIKDLLCTSYEVETIKIFLNLKRPYVILHKDLNITYYKVPFEQNELQGPFVLGIGKSTNRVLLFEDFNLNYGIDQTDYVNLIDRTAYIAPSCKLNQGLLVEPHAIVSSATTIHFGTVIRRGASIGHHNEIGELVDINPGAIIAGGVKIGRLTQIGAGAVIRDHVTIGSNTVIGMGSVVTKNIPSNCIAYGNPCKVINYLHEAKT